jgi:hypothetical protein
MSKIALSGNLSGTGTFTIASPNGNSDRTLTLPDASGTLNTSGAPNVVPAGTVSAPAITTSGDTNTGIFFPAADTIAFAEGGAEAMRIDSDGDVGIGTTTPGKKLDILSNTSQDGIRISGSSNPRLTIIDTTTPVQFDALCTDTEAVLRTDTNHPLVFSTNGTERARITDAGNVGIATSSPGNRLSVSGVAGVSGAGGGGATVPSTAHTSSSLLRLGLRGSLMTSDNADLSGIGTYLSTNAFFRNASGNPGYIVTAAASQIRMINDVISFARAPSGTADTDISFSESARIDSSGNLLVGATVTPTGSTGGAGFIRETGARSTLYCAVNTTGSAGLINFVNPNGIVGFVSTSNTTTTYSTSSDYRLKHDIQPMTGALATVAALKPVTYKWNADDSESQGFIAHELQEVVPECVTGEKDAVDAEGNPQYQGIDTSFLVATLAAAIKEQQAIIEQLKTRIEALEGTQP